MTAAAITDIAGGHRITPSTGMAIPHTMDPVETDHTMLPIPGETLPGLFTITPIRHARDLVITVVAVRHHPESFFSVTRTQPGLLTLPVHHTGRPIPAYTLNYILKT